MYFYQRFSTNTIDKMEKNVYICVIQKLPHRVGNQYLFQKGTRTAPSHYRRLGDDDSAARVVKIMTLEQILADIKSDRVKKVIFDADAGNEIDDQYALAYAISCEKFDVLSVSASQFLNTALVPDRKEGMMEGYREIKRVLNLIGREDIPVYMGVGDALESPNPGEKCPDVIPVDCEAVDNIISTAKSSDEIVYIMVTGCATNISSAIAKDPTIKDNICVLWMGCAYPDMGAASEFNLGQDRFAGRYLMNCGVPMVWLPTESIDATWGTQTLKEGRAFLENGFSTDTAAGRYFRSELPLEHDGGYDEDPDGWWHIFWDVAAPAILEKPDLCQLEIVDIPRIRGDEVYNFGEPDRPRAIMFRKFTDPKAILDDMIKGINKII